MNLSPDTRAMTSMRRVSFSFHSPESHTIPCVRRRMSSGYYRGLIKNCSIAQRELFQHIERLTHGGIFPLTDDPEEDPLKVNNPNVPWDEDESPIELLEAYKNHPCVREQLFQVLFRYCSDKKRGTVLLVPYECLQLQVNCSGTGFQTPIFSTVVVVQQTIRQKSDPIPIPKKQCHMIEEEYSSPASNSPEEIRALMKSLSLGPSLPTSFGFEFEF